MRSNSMVWEGFQSHKSLDNGLELVWSESLFSETVGLIRRGYFIDLNQGINC